MPFLRFSKDRRGYESTFLLHATREAGDRETPILLYWFRTPPHVKIGRAALDEETIRVLEDTHPQVEFDWPRILSVRPQPSEPARPARQRRREEGGERGDRGERPAVTLTRPAPPPRPDVRPAPAESAPPSAPVPPPPPVQPEPEEPPVPARRFVRVFDAGPPESPAAPTTEAGPVPEAGRLSEPSASDRALGSEELERLRGRYAAVMARIARRITDPALADRLRALAERANPDTWVTDAEVRRGLAGLNEVYEELVRHVGRRRRRRRRSGRGEGESTPQGPADAQSDSEENEAVDEGPEGEPDRPDE